MKKRLLLFLLSSSAALAQLLVNDPINTIINTAIQSAQASSHLEVLRQWAEQLEKLNQQIRQLENQLAEQRRIREAMMAAATDGCMVLVVKVSRAL